MKMNTFSSHFFKVILTKTVFPVLALFLHAPSWCWMLEERVELTRDMQRES